MVCLIVAATIRCLADEHHAPEGSTHAQQALQLHVYGGARAGRRRSIPRVVVHVRSGVAGDLF